MAVGIESIDKLRLDIAFGRHFDGAWTVRADSRLLVIDDDADNVSRFSDSEEDEPRALVVLNENNRTITLLSIDHKLIADHPGGIADCAVFDDEKFDFVEFKTNAYGNSEESIRDTFEKAYGQLKETLNVFDEKMSSVGINLFETMVVECRIVVSQRFPRATAAKQNYQALFAEETKGITLYFERLVRFE